MRPRFGWSWLLIGTRGRISLGLGVRLAGKSYADMLDELGRRGIATIRLEPGELERELAGSPH